MRGMVLVAGLVLLLSFLAARLTVTPQPSPFASDMVETAAHAIRLRQLPLASWRDWSCWQAQIITTTTGNVNFESTPARFPCTVVWALCREPDALAVIYTIVD